MMNPRIKASLISIATDVFLITVKSVLAFMTGSAALLADAYHSLSDLFTSFAVLTGAASRSWIEKKEQKKRAQRETQPTEGAGQMEAEAGGDKQIAEQGNETAGENDEEKKKAPPGYWIESAVAYVISLVILYIPYEIITGVANAPPYKLDNLFIAVVGVIVCILTAYFISRFKIIAGKKVDSPALVADGYHSRMDMFTSIVVLVSIVGQMIGLSLDPLMAVVIAVMIGIVGLELFIGSILGFVKRSNLKQLSLWHWLYSLFEKAVIWLVEKTTGRRLLQGDLKLAERFHPSKWITKRRGLGLLALVIAAYFAYGLTIIRADETGVKMRFGKIVDADIEPGLTYVLPYPFESLIRVYDQSIRRVEVGFRTNDRFEGGVSPTLWETRHQIEGYQKVKEESITLTGDENIVDMSLTLHYRLQDALSAFMHVNDLDALLRGLLESAARQVVAKERANRLFVEDRHLVLDKIREQITEDAERLDIGVDILAVYCHDLHPPIDVVDAFRDVFSAREHKARLLNNAETHRNTSLPKARADSFTRVLESEAYEFEKREMAEGDAEKFLLTSKAYRFAPDLTGYRLFIEMAEKGLAKRKKIIADPDVNQGGYRMWLFRPDGQAGQSPFTPDTKGKKR